MSASDGEEIDFCSLRSEEQGTMGAFGHNLGNALTDASAP